MNLFRKKEEPKEEYYGGTAVLSESEFKSPFAQAITKMKGGITKESAQIEDDTIGKWASTDGLALHPYDPNYFYELYESSEPFAATVDQIGIDTAGLGWKLKLKEGKTENPTEKAKIESLLKNPGDGKTLRDISNQVLRDWGVIGRGAFEIVRNAKGEVAEIYAVKASTIWVHKSKEKFCQKVGNKKVWFKRYGLDKQISKDTGLEGDFSEEEQANELIMFETKYGKNTYYGIPNIMPALLAAVCLREIRSFNLSFFANYTIPAMAVILTGNWKEGTAKAITQFLDEKIKGSESANKTIVLEVPREGTAKFEPLTKFEKEASFVKYEISLEDSILMVYSMPAYRIGKSMVGRLGGTNIREATEIYKNSVIEPLQEKLENIINYLIIEQGLNGSSYEFQYNNLDTRDLTGEIERATSEIEHGVKTPNQVRHEVYGLEGYAEGDKYFISNSLIEVGEAGVKKQDEEDMKLIDEIAKLRTVIKENEIEDE